MACTSVCLFFGLLLGMAHYGAPAEEKCQCGKWTNPSSNKRIVNGQEAKPHSIPWQVYLTEPYTGNQPICGGSLISKKHVLTAAHCNRNINAVVLGGHNWQEASELTIIKIAKITNHPEYNVPSKMANDIAIAEMEKEVELGTNINIVCLPPQALDVSQEQHLIISGWGDLKHGSNLGSATLQYAKVKKVSCLGGTSQHEEANIYKSNFCASQLKKDSCQGDSGGPLTALLPMYGNQRVVQVGVVSWGIECANDNFPGVYTNVSIFVDFIRQNTQGICMTD